MGSKKNNTARQPRTPVAIDVQDEVPLRTRRERRETAAALLGLSNPLELHNFEDRRGGIERMLGGELGIPDLLRAMDRLQELHPVDQRFGGIEKTQNAARCTNCGSTYPTATASRYLALCYVPSTQTRPVLCTACRDDLQARQIVVVVYS